jgi:hypothetical protein
MFSAKFVAFLYLNQLNFFIRPTLFCVGLFPKTIEMKIINEHTDRQQMKRTVVVVLFFLLLFSIIYYLDSNF